MWSPYYRNHEKSKLGTQVFKFPICNISGIKPRTSGVPELFGWRWHTPIPGWLDGFKYTPLEWAPPPSQSSSSVLFCYHFQPPRSWKPQWFQEQFERAKTTLSFLWKFNNPAWNAVIWNICQNNSRLSLLQWVIFAALKLSHSRDAYDKEVDEQH